MNALSFSNVKSFGLRFFASFQKHDVMTLAAALAFYTALSLAPLALLFITVVGFLGADSQANFVTQMKSALGAQAGDAIALIVQNANEHPTAGGVAGLVGPSPLFYFRWVAR